MGSILIPGACAASIAEKIVDWKKCNAFGSLLSIVRLAGFLSRSRPGGTIQKPWYGLGIQGEAMEPCLGKVPPRGFLEKVPGKEGKLSIQAEKGREGLHGSVWRIKSFPEKPLTGEYVQGKSRQG